MIDYWIYQTDYSKFKKWILIYIWNILWINITLCLVFTKFTGEEALSITFLMCVIMLRFGIYFKKLKGVKNRTNTKT